MHAHGPKHSYSDNSWQAYPPLIPGHVLDLFCPPAVGGPANEPGPDPDLPSLPPPGKSALHWAAAVNNVEATLALLKNGANKDMQDSKVSPSPWPTWESAPAQLPQVAESRLGWASGGIHPARSQLCSQPACSQGWDLGPRGFNSGSEEEVYGSCWVTLGTLLNSFEPLFSSSKWGSNGTHLIASFEDSVS